MFKWANLFRGFLMGICEIIPGISSGTMALLLGIYDQFLGAISRIVSKHFKKAVLYLLPLVIGMGIAILTMSSLMDYLLTEHMIPTHWFFIGMVLGVVPMMFGISNYRVEFRPAHYLVMGLVTILLYWMSTVNESGAPADTIDISVLTLTLLFFSGMLASSVMLLPGISGSLVLLIIGAYPIIMRAISEFTSLNFEVAPLLIATGLGIVSGLLLASRGIQFLLRNYTYITYAAIIGLLFGSVFPLYPGLPDTSGTWIASIVSLAAGLSISTYMGSKNKETI
jgi:putative membrane protein